MLTLRCAVVGGATVSSVRVTLPKDATVRDLQRALATRDHLQMSDESSGTAASANCGGFRGDAEDTHAHLDEETTTTTSRLFLAKTCGQRERRLHEDGEWLRMNDSALEVLLTPTHDSSSCSSCSSSIGGTAAANAASDVDTVRREYLSPERELLPHTKLLEVFGDAWKADKRHNVCYTSATTASAVHVLVVFQEDAATTATMSAHSLQSSPSSDDAQRAATARIHNARAFACSPVRQKRRRCADSSKWSAGSAMASASDPRTDPDSDGGGDNDMDASVFASRQEDKDTSDFSDNKVHDDPMGMPPTHDPYLLRLLRPQYDAMPRERYELRSAPVSDAAVAVLLNRLARVEAEYGAVLSRAGRRERCLALLFAAVCALFPRGHEPELRVHVGIPGDDLRVLATFDFTLQHGDTHVGVVVAKPQTDRLCPHLWCQYRRKQQLCSHCDDDDDKDGDEEEEEEESGGERENQQSRRQRQARERAAMEHALQHNWLGAEVLADTARVKPPRVVFGVVTSYRKWVFLRYDGVRVQAHEATLQLASGGVVPLQASLAEITGLVAQMLLEGEARGNTRPNALCAAATGTEQTGECRVS